MKGYWFLANIEGRGQMEMDLTNSLPFPLKLDFHTHTHTLLNTNRHDGIISQSTV